MHYTVYVYVKCGLILLFFLIHRLTKLDKYILFQKKKEKVAATHKKEKSYTHQRLHVT